MTPRPIGDATLGPGSADSRTADEVRTAYGMVPIPQEGGWYAAGPRTSGLNGILALVSDEPAGFSALHRLTVTEGWQWLGGDPLEMLQLDPDGTGRVLRLDGDSPQSIVPAGAWQGARTLGRWTLFACWCTPAFTDDCFTLGTREDLVGSHPDHAALIAALTRENT